MGQEVGGKGVAQAVGGDVLLNASPTCSFFNDLPESEPCHPFAPISDEQGVASSTLHNGWPALFQIAEQCIMGRYPKWNEAFLISFTSNSNKCGRKIDPVKRKGHQFRDTYPSGVEELQHGVVTLNKRALDGRECKEPIYLLNA